MISKEVPSKRDDTKGEKAGNVAVGQLCRKLMLWNVLNQMHN